MERLKESDDGVGELRKWDNVALVFPRTLRDSDHVCVTGSHRCWRDVHMSTEQGM
jgi:hypothetical protein